MLSQSVVSMRKTSFKSNNVGARLAVERIMISSYTVDSVAVGLQNPTITGPLLTLCRPYVTVSPLGLLASKIGKVDHHHAWTSDSSDIVSAHLQPCR